MEVKNTHMTDEYAANFLLQQGYLAGRIEALQMLRSAGQLGANRKDGFVIVDDSEESNGD